MSKKHGLGWVPDMPDFRDYKFSERISALEVLPEASDLRLSGKLSPVEDQGQLGSCVGNALAGAMEYLENKDGVPFYDLSRLFIYYNARALEGTTRYDAGCAIRDGIKSLAAQGVCPESKWPYIISKFARKPTKTCYTAAAKNTIIEYMRLSTLTDMKSCLAAGYPFVFGFSVYESFESDEVANTGVVPMPDRSEKLLGGHAVLAVGYNDEEQRIAVRNSWSADWGQAGYFTMPYAYVSNTDLADDLWTIRKGTQL